MKKVIKFYAEWCGPCKAYAGIFERAIEGYRDSIEVLEIDVDKDTEGLAGKYRVRSIPTTVFIDQEDNATIKTGILSEIEIQNILK